MTEDEVYRWRKGKRQELLKCRQAITPAQREAWSEAITAALRPLLVGVPGPLAFYWPFKGEYDPRPLVTSLHAEGTRVALPVVTGKAAPLVFREWWPDAPMTPGIWNIPIPAAGPLVLPTVLLIPLLGFDLKRYRLGYGGGYYDRTLAALPTRPKTVGVGFALGQLPSIDPQPCDIAMDAVVTEHGVL